MTATLALAHLSDIHLPPATPYLVNRQLKRMLGMLNWHRNRRRHHLGSTLAAIVSDMTAQDPDHIAVTGDLVNLGLPVEHAAAMQWLAGLGPPSKVTAIPGNHDIYVDATGVTQWQGFMADDLPAVLKEPFPFVRRLGRIALVGLNSALPTPVFQAFGRLGEAQLERLAGVLDRLGREGLVRVVLIHHPPLPGQAPHRKALQDAAALAAVLASHGAELVLHGHNHRSMIAFAAGPVRPIPIVGVPSASIGLGHGAQALAAYNLYRIHSDPAAPVELVQRGFAGFGGGVVELRRLTLRPAETHALA